MTNRELRDRAEALAAELGVEVRPERLSHTSLEELVASLEERLQAQKAAKPIAPAAPAPPAPHAPAAPLVDGAAPVADGGPPQAKAAAPAPAGRYPYTVAPRKSVLCPGGRVIGAGREIRARDLVHDARDVEQGEKTLAHFVARGVVVKA